MHVQHRAHKVDLLSGGPGLPQWKGSPGTAVQMSNEIQSGRHDGFYVWKRTANTSAGSISVYLALICLSLLAWLSCVGCVRVFLAAAASTFTGPLAASSPDDTPGSVTPSGVKPSGLTSPWGNYGWKINITPLIPSGSRNTHFSETGYLSERDEGGGTFKMWRIRDFNDVDSESTVVKLIKHRSYSQERLLFLIHLSTRLSVTYM